MRGIWGKLEQSIFAAEIFFIGHLVFHQDESKDAGCSFSCYSGKFLLFLPVFILHVKE